MSSPAPATSKPASRPAARPLAQYFWIVCVGYAVDLGSYVGMTGAGVPLYAAYLASFAIGTTCNVLLLRRFFAAGRHAFGKDLAMTMASNGFFILLAMGIYAALMQLLGVHHVLAKVISNGFSFVANYLVRRKYF
jgi:putative flippase GtrA